MKIKNFFKIYIKKKNLFLTIFILSLISNYSFPKNIYYLLNNTFEARNVAQYDYCGDESIGFLNDIKKKYRNFSKFEFHNFFISPNSKWYLEQVGVNKSFNTKVLLGYNDRNEIKLIKNKNFFQSDNVYKKIDNINSVSIKNKHPNEIRNVKFKFFLSLDGFNYKELIYEHSEKILKPGLNFITINKKILSENNSNIRIVLKFDEKYHNYFDELALIENKKFDLKKYVVLENYQNCYLIQNL